MDVSGRYTDGSLPSLTPTGWTILGFLSLYPRNGYQLRQAVQRSVGHFWGVSFGQLYPQLKVLHENGYIAPTTASATSASVWELTAAGRAALDQWLATPPAPASRRDEGMVKLLFADHAGPAVMLSLIRDRRAAATRTREIAESTVPGAHWPSGVDREPDDVLATWLVRAHTIAIATAELAWCDSAEETLIAHGIHPDHPTTQNGQDDD